MSGTFGCIKSPIDLRDFKLNKKVICSVNYPATFELPRPQRVKDQKQICSCTAHATSSILEYHDQGKTKLSTNFIYGIHRKLYGTSGPGMTLRDALKTVLKYGDMTYSDCPGNTEVDEVYSIANDAFSYKTKLETAAKFKILKYARLNNEDSIKYALMHYGPVLASVKWYSYTVNKETGYLTFDTSTKHGYHAIVIVGWDTNGWIIQNSWGRYWGKEGYCTIPYNLCPDEAYSIIDDSTVDSTTVVSPTHNSKILNCVYKALSAIANFINRK